MSARTGGKWGRVVVIDRVAAESGFVVLGPRGHSSLERLEPDRRELLDRQVPVESAKRLYRRLDDSDSGPRVDALGMGAVRGDQLGDCDRALGLTSARLRSAVACEPLGDEPVVLLAALGRAVLAEEVGLPRDNDKCVAR
jgi:hypothetical protein